MVIVVIVNITFFLDLDLLFFLHLLKVFGLTFTCFLLLLKVNFFAFVMCE